MRGKTELVVGIDEAGRGPLAGPVVAAAVILPEGFSLDGLTDSKRLTPKRREELATAILGQAVSWGLGRAEVTEIDRVNILQATLLAMQRAVAQLRCKPDLALVDGNQAPSLDCSVRTVVQGDLLEPAISAASILAKVNRDREMTDLSRRYPGYGFETNKGYPTARHLRALADQGASRAHRRSFGPVRAVLERVTSVPAMSCHEL